jgi:asparagine synthase (glutamine-hydrolysing)
LCGIVGFTSKNWRPDPERIWRATSTLRHRGPDQQGVYRSPNCYLGAARLKIVDLANGDQPFCSEDRDSVIVYNGEIYNHLEIRKDLEARGHRFLTQCDTETVLHAFLEWHTGCFEKLRGMFSIAIWSNSQQSLILARDRLGIKPLYIAKRGEDLFFASELKAILIHPQIERRLSREALDAYLSVNYIPSPWTMIEGVEKLPPGHWLEWRDGRISSHCYWRIPEMTPAQISFEDARSQLDLLLQQSVGEHMMSDVPLGVWISGGIDSTTILHYAAQASCSRLCTFSISFHGHSFDESDYIAEVVQQYGTAHEQIDLNPNRDLEGAIREISYYSDEPSADSGALPVWFLSKLCRTRCTVAFSGEGADEIFGGYLTYRANRIAAWLRRLPPSALQVALRYLNAAWPASNEKISLEYQLKRLLTGSLLPPEQAHVYWNGSFSEEEKAGLLHVPLPGALRDILASLRDAAPGDGTAPFMQFDQQYYLPDDILVKSDRMSMAHSVEVRPPFLDHRIVEFAATLPTEFKVRGRKQKILLKALMKSRLPASIVRRKKVGFDIPAHAWFRGTLRDLWMETLDQAEAEYSDLFAFERIRQLSQLHMSQRISIGYHLWGLMTLFLWMRQWKLNSIELRHPPLQISAIG